MAIKVKYSMASLQMGPVGADGGMGTDLVDVDDPVRDTAVITQADGTKTPFPQEIADDPYFAVTIPGDKELDIDFYAKNAAQMKKICGGTVTPGASGAPDSWSPGPDEPTEQSVAITMKDGSKIELARVNVNFTFEWKFQRSGLPLIHVKGDILNPVDPTTGLPHATAKWIKVTDAPTA